MLTHIAKGWVSFIQPTSEDNGAETFSKVMRMVRAETDIILGWEK